MMEDGIDYNNKNDKIKESDAYWTIDVEKSVKLRTEMEPTIKPISIVELLKQMANKYPNNSALMYKSKNLDWTWTPITYRDYRKKIEHIAKVFIKLGLKEYHSVGVLAFNCPEWFIAALSAIHAHGIITGIYTTNSAEAVHQILATARVNIVIVDDTKQMEKILQIENTLPLLKAIIQLNGPFQTSGPKYFKWSDLESMDVSDVEKEYDMRQERIAINECCSMVFTSGTTGQPKGAMLNHDNILFACRATIKRLPDIHYGEEVFVSYLPLSHVAAQVLEFFIVICCAGCSWFADRDALKGSLVNTLTAARPTRFFGVPRVYEKIHEKMKSVSEQNNFLVKAIATCGKSVTLNHYMAEINGEQKKSNLLYKLVRYCLMSKVRRALGFDRCISMASGAAPLSLELKKYFLSLDMKILDAYGMSETSAPHLLTPSEGPINLESVGIPLPGCDAKVINLDKNGHGELCLSGRNIFMGYIGLLDKTMEALDNDGYLHSGDIAYIDKEGFVTITGRLKEIIITAGGENIAPLYVENLIKNELPFISNVFLVGDRKKFLTVLLTLKTKINEKNLYPSDELEPVTVEWLSSLGFEFKSLKDVFDSGPAPAILESIQQGINRANNHAISNAQKIQKFTILPHDFSIPTGELGPTLKVKRNEVVEKYHSVIEKFYEE